MSSRTKKIPIQSIRQSASQKARTKPRKQPPTPTQTKTKTRKVNKSNAVNPAANPSAVPSANPSANPSLVPTSANPVTTNPVLNPSVPSANPVTTSPSVPSANPATSILKQISQSPSVNDSNISIDLEADKLVQDKLVQEQDKLVQDKLVQEKLVQDKLVQDKLAQDKLAQEQDKLAQEQEKLVTQAQEQEEAQEQEVAQEQDKVAEEQNKAKEINLNKPVPNKLITRQELSDETWNKFFTIFGFGKSNNWTDTITALVMFGLDVAGTDVDNLRDIRKYIIDHPEKSAEIRLMLITAGVKMGINTIYPAVPMTIQKFNEAMVGILEDINNKVKESNDIIQQAAEVKGGFRSKKISRKHIYKRINDSLKRYHKTTTFKKCK